MLKKDALDMFNVGKLDEFAYGVQGGRIKLNDIPSHYQNATRMVLKHGRNWWKHLEATH